jgi:hypothetical protein
VRRAGDEGAGLTFEQGEQQSFGRSQHGDSVTENRSEGYVEVRGESVGKSDGWLGDREELHHANRLVTVGKLAATMAHELRTPLLLHVAEHHVVVSTADSSLRRKEFRASMMYCIRASGRHTGRQLVAGAIPGFVGSCARAGMPRVTFCDAVLRRALLALVR